MVKQIATATTIILGFISLFAGCAQSEIANVESVSAPPFSSTTRANDGLIAEGFDESRAQIHSFSATAEGPSQSALQVSTSAMNTTPKVTVSTTISNISGNGEESTLSWWATLPLITPEKLTDAENDTSSLVASLGSREFTKVIIAKHGAGESTVYESSSKTALGALVTVFERMEFKAEPLPAGTGWGSWEIMFFDADSTTYTCTVMFGGVGISYGPNILVEIVNSNEIYDELHAALAMVSPELIED